MTSLEVVSHTDHMPHTALCACGTYYKCNFEGSGSDWICNGYIDTQICTQFQVFCSTQFAVSVFMYNLVQFLFILKLFCLWFKWNKLFLQFSSRLDQGEPIPPGHREE